MPSKTNYLFDLETGERLTLGDLVTVSEEELAAALDEAIAAQDAATQPLYAAEDLYYELSEEEQQREDVQTVAGGAGH